MCLLYGDSAGPCGSGGEYADPIWNAACIVEAQLLPRHTLQCAFALAQPWFQAQGLCWVLLRTPSDNRASPLITEKTETFVLLPCYSSAFVIERHQPMMLMCARTHYIIPVYLRKLSTSEHFHRSCRPFCIGRNSCWWMVEADTHFLWWRRETFLLLSPYFQDSLSLSWLAYSRGKSLSR